MLTFIDRLYFDLRTASIIATFTVHSKLDYCNSLYFSPPSSQINRLQHIQNSLVLLSKPPNSIMSHRLLNLHWLRINERVDCKLLSLTHSTHLLETRITWSLFKFLAVGYSFQIFCRHSPLAILARRPTSSSLKITNRSFQHAQPYLSNTLPVSLRQPCTNQSPSLSPHFTCDLYHHHSRRTSLSHS